MCYQERLISKEQKISDNFYVRGDGTVSSTDANWFFSENGNYIVDEHLIAAYSCQQRAFYFSDEFLVNLFNENGFDSEEHILCFKQVENRSRDLVMNRYIYGHYLFICYFLHFIVCDSIWLDTKLDVSLTHIVY